MLTLEIKDQQLNTSDDFSCEIEDQNPATSFDELPGSKAIGLEFPVNDQNRLILRNPERFEKLSEKNDRKFSGAALRHHGQLVQAGTLVIDEATKKSYGGWIKDVIGNLAERVTGKYINQSELGGVQSFVNKITYDPTTDDYCCPKIFNQNFWYDRGKKTTFTETAYDLEGNEYTKDSEVGNLTLQFMQNESSFVNFPTGGGVAVSGENIAPAVSPFLFLWKALELILKDNQIFVKENFLKNNADLQKLFIYHNFSVGIQDFTIETKYIFEMDWGEGYEPGVLTNTITDVLWDADTFLYRNLLPNITPGELILSTQNWLNVVFAMNDLNECHIVDRNLLLTAEAYDIDKYMVGEWEIGERKDVRVVMKNETDSNDSAFISDWEDLSDEHENFKPSVAAEADLGLLDPELDEIRLVIAEEAYYKYHWYVVTTVGDDGEEDEEDALGWERVSNAFQSYFFNDGEDKDEETIETTFAPIRMSKSGYPLVSQQGNSAAFKSQFADFGLRAMFYEGISGASNETDNLALTWHGDKGLVEKRWKHWLNFQANRLPVKAIFKFPASEYYYIKNNKHSLPLRTRHGSFIIDKMNPRIGKADLIEVEIEGFKRESNVYDYNEGAVDGEGGVTTSTFDAWAVGLSTSGSPCLVKETGTVRTTSISAEISSAYLAAQCCVEYSSAYKLLFIGGDAGQLTIIDVANSFTKKTIALGATTANLSCVRLVNNKLLIGIVGSARIYEQPYFSSVGSYADAQATQAGIMDTHASGSITDIIYWGGYYWGCSRNGEVVKSSDLLTWAQSKDFDAHFTHMVETENYLWILEDDDRNFRSPKTDPDNWQEFDLKVGDEPEVIEAVPMLSDRVLCITSDAYQGARLVTEANIESRDNLLTPSLAKYCKGAFCEGGSAVISIKEASGATKIARYNVVGGNWNYINVPASFGKLFPY